MDNFNEREKNLVFRVWDWLGDREVFFCEDEGNIFSNSPDQMLKCIDFMAVYGRSLFLRLKDKMTCTKNNIYDCMEHIACYETYSMGRDEVMEIHMSDEDQEPIDVIEINKFLKQDEVPPISTTLIK
jgi:hypothetical protein